MFVKCDKEKTGSLKKENINALNDLLYEHFPRVGKNNAGKPKTM